MTLSYANDSQRAAGLWLASWVILVAFATVPGVGFAQGASIEELEQRIQKAKDEKVRRDAAAAKSTAEGAAARARLATLVVQTDAACTLSVNGKKVAQLDSGGITEVRVPPGQSLVSCLSREENIAFEDQVEARSGQNTVLRISLAQHVEAAQRSRRQAEDRTQRERREAEERAQRERREVEERAQRERQEAEARARAEAASKAACERGEAKVLTATGDPSVLRQCGNGLLWTSADTVQSVGWSEAQAHCRGLGGGWTLPTVAQLQSLYSEDLPGVPCPEARCRVSNQFRLRSHWFWSSESNGSSEAWLVHLNAGGRKSAHLSVRVGDSTNSRALCVRRP